MTEPADTVERCPWCDGELESYTPPPPTGFLAEVRKELRSAAERAGVSRSVDLPRQHFRCLKSSCGYMSAVPVEDPIP